METSIKGPYEQIMLFGDSITEWSNSQESGFAFQPALQNLYIRRFDVVNRGFSGYNTAMAKRVLYDFMPTRQQAKVRLMTIFFGANDACLRNDSDEVNQHVPLDQFKSNLKDILNNPKIIAQNPRIMLITPPPIDEYMLDNVPELKGSRKAEVTKVYAEACLEVAHGSQVVVLDLWSEMMKAVGWSPDDPVQRLPGSKNTPPNADLAAYFTDGLHFTPKAYQILFRSVKSTIEKAWPEMKTGENFKSVLPLWREAIKDLKANPSL